MEGKIRENGARNVVPHFGKTQIFSKSGSVRL